MANLLFYVVIELINESYEDEKAVRSYHLYPHQYQR
jgi:hypothetical protein